MNPTAAIALNRFGTGARPGDLESASVDPGDWLIHQLEAGNPFAPARPFTHSQQALGQARSFRQLKKNNQQMQVMAGQSDANPSAQQLLDAEKKMRRKIAGEALGLASWTLEQQVLGENGLQSRLLDFFSNHFSVSATNIGMVALAPTLELEAIAPHLTGRFGDMLIAVEQHPAMLYYLNNEQSTGPDSRVGQRRKKRGLNENLAREILELHTLGVDGGYTQKDVRELAMAITGWTVANKEERRGFVFRQGTHQPGRRTLLSQSFAQKGVDQGVAILSMLATHPSTARHISFKLARHFIADEPPESLVKAMKDKWLATGGDLKQVVRVMITHPDSWQPQQQKLKTPREFMVSALRAGLSPVPAPGVIKSSLEALGQLPFSAGSPAGFGDIADSWDGADALMRRAEWSYQLAGKAAARKGSKLMPPSELAVSILGEQLRDDTLGLIKRTENTRQAYALLLMSPEFQRR